MTKRSIVLLPAALLVAVLAVGVPTPSAAAQSSSKKVEKLEPPTPGQARTDSIVVPMLLGIVIAAAAVGVNLIPSKRGHQD